MSIDVVGWCVVVVVVVVVVCTLGRSGCQSPHLSIFPLGTALPAIGLRSS